VTAWCTLLAEVALAAVGAPSEVAAVVVEAGPAPGVAVFAVGSAEATVADAAVSVAATAADSSLVEEEVFAVEREVEDAAGRALVLVAGEDQELSSSLSGMLVSTL
jgi:hypothetical protein